MISLALLFDGSFSKEGWICFNSVYEQNLSNNIYILCLDEQVSEETKTKSVIPIQLCDLENAFPELLKVKPDRPWNAYTQTCKVFLPSYIFKTYGEQKVCYVDSDMLFWGDFSEVEKELGDYHFMVAPREETPPKAQGRYNGGFFACSNESENFLKWWQDKTIEWCLWKKGPEGRFGEEGYLNIFHEQPDKFEKILVTKHPGFNLAYWNLRKHKVELINNKIIIDGNFPLICFHYQGFKLYNKNCSVGLSKPSEAEKFIYSSYLNKFK